MEYRLESSSIVYAPGFVRWAMALRYSDLDESARVGYRKKGHSGGPKNLTEWARWFMLRAWGDAMAKTLASGYPYTVEGDAVVVWVSE